MSATSYLRSDEREDVEHECPVPLEAAVDEFGVGGMFWSPAGRWETITDRSPYAQFSTRITIHTDKTGADYGWTFWSTDKFPYLSPWRAQSTTQVKIVDWSSMMEVQVSGGGGRRSHVLLSAQMIRGKGWVISDRPNGTEVENLTVPSKARARSEVNRRARAHAKRLGLQVARDGERS